MVRKIEFKDINECIKIAKIIFNTEDYSFDIEKELKAAFDYNNIQFTIPEYFIFQEDNIIKGFAGLSNSGFDNQIFGFFSCYVLPEYQGKGIGKKLTEARIKRINDIGAEMILSTTRKPWHLERFGFKKMNLEIEHDWITMYKQLK